MKSWCDAMDWRSLKRAFVASFSSRPADRLAIRYQMGNTGGESGKTMTDGKLDEMVRRLVESFRPERIFLFGSRARGNETADSDYDLLMVVSDSPLPRYRRDQAAFRVLCGVGAGKDVIVMTRREFDVKRSAVCSLPSIVEREGRLVYVS